MNTEEQKEMNRVILEKIEETKEEIEHLKELTKPVAPDKAIGRLSRMDAINNKTINEAALREQTSRLQKLGWALTRLEEGNYGACVTCDDPILLGRLKFMPWTTKCVKCA